MIVYPGFSAAAVIVSSTLRALDHVSDPSEIPLGYDPAVMLAGLGLLPFAVVVHFQSDHPKPATVTNEVKFYERNNIPCQTPRDAEQAVVAKSARVVEEVVVGKEASSRTETINDTVRGTDVEVERTAGTGAGANGSPTALVTDTAPDPTKTPL